MTIFLGVCLNPIPTHLCGTAVGQPLHKHSAICLRVDLQVIGVPSQASSCTGHTDSLRHCKPTHPGPSAVPNASSQQRPSLAAEATDASDALAAATEDAPLISQPQSARPTADGGVPMTPRTPLLRQGSLVPSLSVAQASKAAEVSCADVRDERLLHGLPHVSFLVRVRPMPTLHEPSRGGTLQLQATALAQSCMISSVDRTFHAFQGTSAPVTMPPQLLDHTPDPEQCTSCRRPRRSSRWGGH